MSELRAALAGALGPLYRIEREVRPVGEYRLFVATQSENGTQLLVKVLPAVLSLGINDLQFERAVLLLGERLSHPNLVRPRGAGRAGAFVYHTRPFVPGTTLRAWIGNNGAIPLWLTEWQRSRWSDAGRALAGMRPPPPSSSQSSQLFA